MNRAGFGIRFGAVLIDAVIVGVVSWILRMIFVHVSVDPNMTADQVIAATSTAVSRSMLIGGICGLGMAACEVVKAQSPGKMILKLIIASADGSPATQMQIIKRCALKYGFSAFYLLAGITGIWLLGTLGGLVALVYAGGSFMALGQTKQALHDLLGGTCVLQTGTVAIPSGFPVQMPGQAPPPPPTA